MDASVRRAILSRVRIAQYTDNPEEPIVACNPVDRGALVDLFNAVGEGQRKHDSRWGFCMRMPCGNEKHFASHDDIPFDDLPCSCGRENHFFVKYSLKPLGLNELAHIN